MNFFTVLGMKKAMAGLALGLASLLSAIAASYVVTAATGNPYPWNSEIAIESPTNKTYNVSTLVLNVTVTTKFDGLYTSSSKRLVNCSLDSQPAIPIEEAAYSYDNRSQASTFFGWATLSGLSDGFHTLKVQSRYYYEVEVNAAGNDYITQSHYAVEYVNFTIDTTPPAISILDPVSNSVLSAAVGNASLPLTFRTDEATSWVGYCLDGQETLSIAGNTSLSGLSTGLHNITVYANDTVGNMGQSETVSFTVETPNELFRTLPEVALAATGAALIAVAVLVYMKKRKT